MVSSLSLQWFLFYPQSACEASPSSEGDINGGVVDDAPRPPPSHYFRTVTITKETSQNLGMSVTVSSTNYVVINSKEKFTSSLYG